MIVVVGRGLLLAITCSNHSITPRNKGRINRSFHDTLSENLSVVYGNEREYNVVKEIGKEKIWQIFIPTSVYPMIQNNTMKNIASRIYTCFFTLAPLLMLSSCTSENVWGTDIWDSSSSELAAYRVELDAFRNEFRSKDMPDVRFFLFGMGDRTKLLYKEGKLVEALTGTTIGAWEVEKELIVPSEYRVVLQTVDGKTVVIQEDTKSVWISEEPQAKKILAGTESPLILPSFEGNKYARILKVLYQEILINIVQGIPYPNYFAYKTDRLSGWRRDGAMMAMCLEKTGNIDLIKPWVLGFTDPYDRNNAGEEADNLGQTLYLISLFADKNHPAVLKTLEEIKRWERTNDEGTFIRGRTDFQETPAYQTKLLKWGLKKIGLPDDYIIPHVRDRYSSLFWWDYKDSYVPEHDARDDRYPYLGWAADHFHGTKDSPISNRDYPLTWEFAASQADYSRIKIVSQEYAEQKCAAPHTWHTAEIFLYLLDQAD